MLSELPYLKMEAHKVRMSNPVQSKPSLPIFYTRHYKRIAADLHSIKEAQRFVYECLTEWRKPVHDAWKIELAIEEVLSNIILHGYSTEMGLIELEFLINPLTATLTLQIQDDGVPFNPLEDGPILLAKQPIEKQELSGLGIRLIMRTMDTVSYERAGNHNILTLTKKL